MAESISPDLQLRTLRVLLNAPDNYQREIRARIRKLLLAAESPEQGEQFVEKYLARIQEKINQNATSRNNLLLANEDENGNTNNTNNNNNEEAEEQTRKQAEPPIQQHKSEDE